MKTTFSLLFYCFMIWLKLLAFAFIIGFVFGIIEEHTTAFAVALILCFCAAISGFFLLLSFYLIARSYFHYFPYQNKTQLKRQLHILGVVGVVSSLILVVVSFIWEKESNLSEVFIVFIGVLTLFQLLILVENQWGKHLAEVDDYPENQQLAELIEKIGNDEIR